LARRNSGLLGKQEIEVSFSADRFRRLKFAGPGLVALCASILALAACSPTGGQGQGSFDAGVPNLPASPTVPVQAEPLSGGPAASATPNQIGSGPVHVALILPLTQNGAPSPIGISLRNAAELALDEAHNKDLTLIVEDDQSTPQGATAAAQAAASQGVSLAIGPLFASSVQQAAAVMRPANIPMIAFSTDASVASSGVYLLSFLVETYVDRIVDYAAAHGKRSFAALVPNTDYGRAAEAEFLQETTRLGVNVRGDEHYDEGQPNPAIQKIAALMPNVDALFIPEQADAMASVGPALASAGLTSNRVQILGTGLWSDPRVLTLPALQGAQFAAPDNSGYLAFAANYKAKFASDPSRISTLAHDAVALAAALAGLQGAQAYSVANLTSTSGFRGVDGIFRFLPNGLNQRGLAVDQIRSNGAVVVSPAPHSFADKPQG
jgi:branched-chain amino acid transport system substrate-binding protein